MNIEELYKLALSDVVEYSLLNEIFAIRDKRVETVDYTIGVNGFISLDVLNDYVEAIQERDKYKSIINEVREFITSEGSIEKFRTIESREEWLKVHDKLLEILDKVGDSNES